MSQVHSHDSQGSALPSPDTFSNAPHSPVDDREEIYYEGSPQLRGEFKQVFTWGLAGVIFIALPISVRFIAPNLACPWWLNLASVLLGIILILVPLIATKAIRYRVSNYRIDYERGILSRNIVTLELWHVEDIGFHQSLFARMMGVGTIQLTFHDANTPLIFIRSVPNARSLFETLKQRIIAVKRQSGVIKVDTGT